LDLLRFSTAGSVDDGKSTLIGRLLYDSKGVFEDQLEAVQRSTLNRSAGPIDLSLLTDGLRAEREQGITIDVAYRYFATPKRKFIIADTPGHEQYTRNMATGASTADLAIILIDARYGALVQSRRHTIIASLLKIPQIVIAVNKMDLVGFAQSRFEEIQREFQPFVDQMGFTGVQWIPLSALNGDNVVTKSEVAPWYDGPSLLEHLETVEIARADARDAFRFPVQYVIRPNLDFRGFAGLLAAGTLKVGDEVLALPAGTRSKVKQIHTHDALLPDVSAPRCVTVLLEDEIDVSRGDMLVHPQRMPWVKRDFDAQLVWMDGTPLDVSRPYLIKHTTRTVRVKIAQLLYRIDTNTLEHVPAETQQLNEISRVRISAAQALYLDSYEDNRTTGSFILIDPLTNATVAAGMVVADQPVDEQAVSSLSRIDRTAREAHNGHRAQAIVLAGTSRDAQAHFARALETRLFHRGVQVLVVDSEGARGDLPVLTATIRLLLSAGMVVLVDLPLDTRQERDALRRQLGVDDVVEMLIDAPEFQADSDFQRPVLADCTIAMRHGSIDAATAQATTWLADRGLFGTHRVVSPGAGI
jgi:sulfate adenylyltransferase large subunit